MRSHEYCWGYEEDDMCNFEDTIKKCLKEAADYDYYDFDGIPKVVYIGEYKPYVPEMSFGGYVLEYYGDEAEYYDSNWLEEVSGKDEEILDDMISEAFKKWCEKTGNEPNFGTIENIKKYDLATGKGLDNRLHAAGNRRIGKEKKK